MRPRRDDWVMALPTDSPLATSWRDVTPRNSRAAVRGLAISTLSAAQQLIGRTTALLRQPRVQVLILHHIFPDEESRFRTLLQRLQQLHTFIPYGEAVRRAEMGGQAVDRPYLAFTFDDGVKNCLRAAPILEEFNARACFFVCPAIVGEIDPAMIESFCRDRLELKGGVRYDFMNWDDLLSLRDRGHEIGGHTMTHANLAAVSTDVAREEIGKCRDVIMHRVGECNHFAWTYGHFRHCTAEAVNIVFNSGYRTCASGVRGCHGPERSDPTLPPCVRRDHIVAGWPIGHSLYFLAKSSRMLSPETGAWPAEWREALVNLMTAK
jgi:hypothetical protein